jgi:hypothetical protein
VLRLLPPGRLVVRIVDAATGAPTVADELWQHGYYERSATSYEEALDVGTYSIVARCLDGRVGAVAAIVEPEHTTTVELALAPGADLRLQRARGGPEEVRARVFAGDAELPSSWLAPGQVDRRTVPAGPLRVEVWRETRLATHELTLEAGEERTLSIE